MTAGRTRLVDRRPDLRHGDLASRFVPPRRFGATRFETYHPNTAHPSQARALAEVQAFARDLQAQERPASRWWRRGVERPSGPPGRYLDGGFGVGKTHLLASLWHAAPGPKAYLTFEELAAFVGYTGMAAAVETFAGHRLVCIDEFELDDVANTRMAVTFLRSLIEGGTRLAATSNAVPDRLGEGRFNAEEFHREISAIASYWQVVRIDGPDYRARGEEGDVVLPAGAVEAVVAGSKTVALDDFDSLLQHLRQVHPVHYSALLDGVDAVVLHGLHPIADQGDALLFVQLVDEIYDAGVRFVSSGCAAGAVFAAPWRNGGYRKKYGRCESRLRALALEALAALE